MEKMPPRVERTTRENFPHKPIHLHVDSYALKRMDIKLLEAYAMGVDGVLDMINLPYSARVRLQTDEGMEELRQWRASFANGLKLMKQFDIERELGQVFNDADWHLMDGSATIAKETLELLLAGELKKKKDS